MLKKFTEGLIFGGGFAISFIILWYLATNLILPMFAHSYAERFSTTEAPKNITHSQPSATESASINSSPVKQFHELELDEQIKLSSVIALAEYVPAKDGKMKAIITELLKNEPGTNVYYNVGDEYTHSSYYPTENTNRGDGMVIFFIGSPAQMRMSMTYRGDRIMGLGDMPIKLLKQKCGKSA